MTPVATPAPYLVETHSISLSLSLSLSRQAGNTLK